MAAKSKKGEATLLVLSLLLPLLLLLQVQVLAVRGDPALPCDRSQCLLPQCRCAGEDIPGKLAPSETPQIVVITFDDSVRDSDYSAFYEEIMAGRKNPNGCNIGWTFFARHYYTDYALVEDLFAKGHEIADHSVTHRTPETWWTNATVEDLTAEIVGQREMFGYWANISKESVKGYRAPYLAASENELKVLHQNNFLYDCSMPTSTLYWPFTLDYKSPLCSSPAVCPKDSYPGLWVVPNVIYQQKNGVLCQMLDACTATQTQADWHDLLTANFMKHYTGNRAPFGLFAHSALFLHDPTKTTIVPAYKAFLDKLATLKDVYIVTVSQLVEWVQQPTPLSDIGSFEPWQCPSRPPPRCDFKKATSCRYETKAHGEIYLRTCAPACPAHFPDIGNPSGN